MDEVTFTMAVYCKTLYEGLILSFEEQEVRMGNSEMLLIIFVSTCILTDYTVTNNTVEMWVSLNADVTYYFNFNDKHATVCSWKPCTDARSSLTVRVVQFNQ